MNKGTKIYALVLITICVGLMFAFFYQPARVRELNQKLENRAEIRNFPYHFKVLRINQGIATINSPISTDVPCGKVIGLIFPQVKGLSILSDDYQQAREQLAQVQTEIEKSILSEPDIRQVKWQLDRGWLIQNGVNIPPESY